MLEESRFPWTHGDADGTVAIDPEARSGESHETTHEPEARETKREPRRDEPEKGRTEGENENASDAKGEDDGTGDQNKEKRPSILRRHPFIVLLVLVAIVAAGVGGYFYWLSAIHPYESTDDAFVDSRQFAVSPQVAGYVSEVLVSDNQHVNAGEVILRIDPRDYQAAVDEADARVAAAQAAINGADAQIAAQGAQVTEAQAAVAQNEASVQFAQEEAARAQTLARSGAGTVQTAQQQTSALRQAEAELNRSRAAVTAAQKQVGSLQAQRATSVADLREANAQAAQARLNLSYVTVTAAQPGRVVQLTGAVGQYVQAGQSVAMFVPDDIWVTANFKETQITDMRPGQAVDIRIDAYPDHEIKGRVDSVQPGSGTAFSLLPAENATGNYVKVVQRVPVKIVADSWPRDVSIGPGMSVVPTVTVRPKD
ncbi:HlyD family secretion protein [Aureimonas jatrophae]|uniref:Membrane fusion protein, multidrug efflux system n=1 Tax=Aureimonas jatrophae TaxID=1166073 RepID=A0A1H0K8L3_9HYPH|nr:HlyD family secretion protein [Aureimonas jatrophae]MBB3951000.1 membrane fusion protein (multidrug efflux system) [Aureimonas jatrophae]SDO52256.1 membrane fusion protein, multidrug efflux system [Aureimonas jatrophae]